MKFTEQIERIVGLVDANKTLPEIKEAVLALHEHAEAYDHNLEDALATRDQALADKDRINAKYGELQQAYANLKDAHANLKDAHAKEVSDLQKAHAKEIEKLEAALANSKNKKGPTTTVHGVDAIPSPTLRRKD